MVEWRPVSTFSLLPYKLMDFLGQLTDKMAAADLSFTCSVVFTIFLDHEHFILSFVFHSREMFRQIVVHLISYSVP